MLTARVSGWELLTATVLAVQIGGLAGLHQPFAGWVTALLCYLLALGYRMQRDDAARLLDLAALALRTLKREIGQEMRW